jgi:hypothetical protein
MAENLHSEENEGGNKSEHGKNLTPYLGTLTNWREKRERKVRI